MNPSEAGYEALRRLACFLAVVSATGGSRRSLAHLVSGVVSRARSFPEYAVRWGLEATLAFYLSHAAGAKEEQRRELLDAGICAALRIGLDSYSDIPRLGGSTEKLSYLAYLAGFTGIVEAVAPGATGGIEPSFPGLTRFYLERVLGPGSGVYRALTRHRVMVIDAALTYARLAAALEPLLDEGHGFHQATRSICEGGRQ